MAVIEDPSIQGVDVIGDVHGEADKLEGLLLQMGYVEIDGAWRHPSRRAVFIGDLIDRGDEQVRTLRIVRAMVEAGAAHIVIGNHEFNAVAYATPDPDQPDEYLRKHTVKSVRQHKEFIDQFGEGSAAHRDVLDWFASLPLWLEVRLGGSALRIAHACWDETSMRALAPVLDADGSLTAQAELAASREGSPEFHAVETLLKGPEIDLGGLVYQDKGGHERHQARLAWWRRDATTLRSLAEIPSNSRTPSGDPFPELPDTPTLPPYGYNDPIPVIYGHYWRTGEHRVDSPYSACVDYSVASNGPMVAYRWNGESHLSDTGYAAFSG